MYFDPFNRKIKVERWKLRKQKEIEKNVFTFSIKKNNLQIFKVKLMKYEIIFYILLYITVMIKRITEFNGNFLFTSFLCTEIYDK